MKHKSGKYKFIFLLATALLFYQDGWAQENKYSIDGNWYSYNVEPSERNPYFLNYHEIFIKNDSILECHESTGFLSPVSLTQKQDSIVLSSNDKLISKSKIEFISKDSIGLKYVSEDSIWIKKLYRIKDNNTIEDFKKGIITEKQYVIKFGKRLMSLRNKVFNLVEKE